MTKVIREQMRMMTKMGLRPQLVRFKKHPIYHVTYNGKTEMVVFPATSGDWRAEVHQRAWLRRKMREMDE